ncbi:MAG: Spy/CpxP family protein refolding chaperone [Hyphomicrobiaceae bacterium]|nr:Spy/CpxP family protein refolding chaperone [Hyphomicrobiaceae bacterium]
MQKFFTQFTAVAVLAGLLISGTALAQPAPDPHHPGGAAAQAQPQGPMPGGTMGPGMMGRMMGGGMMGPGMMDMMANCPMMGGGTSHAEGRIAFLKAELAITEAQNAAWEAYAAQIRKNLTGMQDMQKTMMSMMDAKSPVERLDVRIAMMEKRTLALKEIKPALAALYTGLSADQQKKADQLLTGMGCMM